MSITNIWFFTTYFYVIDNFKYISNISAQEGIILINGQIGNTVDKKGNVSYGVNGSEFAAEMLHLEKTCKNITVRINSVGGSVLDGYSIASSIYNSAVPVTTVIDGLAASTALWCSGAGDFRKAKDYSTGMTHGSSGTDDKEMTALVDKTINIQLSNRSNKTPEEIKAMMDKETWLTAKDMLDMGIIDEIEKTNKKVKVNKADSLYNIANIYNKLISPEMEKVTNRLKLKNDASEDSIVSAIDIIEAENTKLKTDLAEAKNALKVLQDEQDAKDAADKLALKNKAKVFAIDQVKSGKLKADQVEETILNMSKDQASFDFISNIFGVASSTKDAKKIFDPEKVVNTGSGANDRSAWSWSKWSKEDPDGLAKIANGNPEQYQEMYNSEFKKN